MHNIVPDIVTAGKSLNNGHPMSLLVTSHKILASLGQSMVNVVSCFNEYSYDLYQNITEIML